VNWFRLKTCIKCQGDLAADNGDWICLQCGAYYYTGLYQLHQKIEDNPPVADPAMPAHPKKQECPGRRYRPTDSGCSISSVNSR
jgi:hypothetical protein